MATGRVHGRDSRISNQRMRQPARKAGINMGSQINRDGSTESEIEKFDEGETTA